MKLNRGKRGNGIRGGGQLLGGGGGCLLGGSGSSRLKHFVLVHWVIEGTGKGQGVSGKAKPFWVRKLKV